MEPQLRSLPEAPAPLVSAPAHTGDKAGAAALSAHAPGVSKAAQRGGAAPEDSGGAGPRGGGDDAATTLLLDADAASADAAMMRWAEEQGIRARMRPASFGGLRGAAAAGAIWADEPAVEVPASALITLRTALESDIGPLLKILPGAHASARGAGHRITVTGRTGGNQLM